MTNDTILRRPRLGRRILTILSTALALSAAIALPALAQAETPKRGGTLKMQLQSTTASLDPLFGNGGEAQFTTLYAEPLIYINRSYEYIPHLAESWEVENGGKSYVFKLRQGIQFHDGTPLNAEAVKFNFDRLLDPNLAHTKKASASLLESVEVIDDSTVRVSFKDPSELSLVMLSSLEGSVCSPTAIQALGEDFGRKPSCTGPFMIESWTGNEFVTKRNPNYWMDGADGQKLPYLDGVQITVQSNSAVRLVELRSGNVQYIDYVLPKDFDQVRQDPSLKLIDIKHGMHGYTAFNVSKPPFDNKDLREAVAFGVDREALVKVIAPADATVLKYMESPEQLWVYDDLVVGHSYDPERAKAALARSGFTGEVTMLVIQRDPDIQVAQLMQGMLAQIGLKSKIEVVERQGFLDKMNALQHDFLIARMEHGVDPDSQYSAFFDDRGVFNVTGVDRTETTALVGAARVELDREKRRALYKQVTDKILDGYIFSWLTRLPYQTAASARLQDVEFVAGRAMIYRGLWLAD